MISICLFIGVLYQPTILASKEVNVYSARHYDTDMALYEEFTRRTSIEVNLIEGGSDALIERIINEGEFGDIARVGDHLQLKDLILKNLSKKIDKKIIIDRSKKYSVENIINEYNSAIFK